MPEKLQKSSLFISFLDLTLLAFLVFDFGFDPDIDLKVHKSIVLLVILLGLIAFNLYKYWRYRYDTLTRKRAGYHLGVLLLLIVVDAVFIIFSYNGSFIATFHAHRRIIEIGLLFYFFVRLSFLMQTIYRLYFNPAILFVGSYVIVILAGTFLLKLPSASPHYISFTDALFTSTSAVCANGLLAVDLARDLTFFGQTIILVLIQIGGLGMLTFTSFFAFFFKSGTTFREGLFMKNMLGDEQLGNAMQITVQIVVFSLIVEAIGTLFILDSIRGANIEKPAFFAIFHAVSSYCNAGFSTAPENLASPGLRFNYYLQWIVMSLVIFGGLGYFISFNFIKYLKQFFINLFLKRKKKSIVRIITLNTKIVVYTTIILFLVGSVSIFIFEYNTVLQVDETIFGKWTSAMFSAVTARTAGFNTVDYTHFSVSGLLIMILLMWIGASPGSTGGGIKTSSFALAVLNVFSIARNKPHIEIGTRRVATEAVRRAFAIIIISLIFIGIGILLLLTFEPDFSLMQVAFEIFSAFSTVGLSLGITPHLTLGSKYVLLMMMFLGRIGLINLMSGILKNVTTQAYEYPRENILIN